MKLNRTYNKMKNSLLAIITEKNKEIRQLQGYVNYLEEQKEQYRKALEGKQNETIQ